MPSWCANARPRSLSLSLFHTLSACTVSMKRRYEGASTIPVNLSESNPLPPTELRSRRTRKREPTPSPGSYMYYLSRAKYSGENSERDWLFGRPDFLITYVHDLQLPLSRILFILFIWIAVRTVRQCDITAFLHYAFSLLSPSVNVSMSFTTFIDSIESTDVSLSINVDDSKLYRRVIITLTTL